MRKIKEVIIVEGRHDTAALKKYFDCETIETGGTSLDEETQKRILRAAESTGIIILTDPDAPGNQIRHKIHELVPDAKDAYVNKENARTEKKVGVEHAGREELENALLHVTEENNIQGTLTMTDLYDLGLCGRDDSKDQRRKIGRLLHIGYGNAKTMLQRLNHTGITREQILEVLHSE
ncbi:MAG: ribonuclease M5 [Solobacterium sp.]|nr:ribonuclease M5 [Solobacterium sp.]